VPLNSFQPKTNPHPIPHRFNSHWGWALSIDLSFKVSIPHRFNSHLEEFKDEIAMLLFQSLTGSIHTRQK
jgi:hypothetical protein